MQLDNPARGFTFKWEGPLDLRFNPERGQPASALIKAISEKALEKILFINSDEPHAKMIARAIHKDCHKINTTKALADTVKEALAFMAPAASRDEITTSIRRTFQALRIEVNDEFSALEQFLRNLPLCLKPNGRAAILTFHSGEDNKVTKSFRDGLESGIYSDICRDPIRPTPKECFDNPRSKSAILRWAIKNNE
jgi:16S rRNA (cytosine1402-N4)-methyltransferase